MTRVEGLLTGEDGLARCWWGAGDAVEYRTYHDDEWGRELRGDDAVFELLSLEGFQAGLSWLTILRKREGFRRAFAGFVPERVAAFGAADVTRLMADTSIVRNRAKIDAAIRNAVQRASRTLRNLDWFEVAEIRGHIVDGDVEHFQVRLKIGFRVEEE